jgi:CxxC-x17-CxxC domain-containing protein
MTFTDKTFTCTDCGTAFVVRALEQHRQAMAGYRRDPEFCPSCRPAGRATESRRAPIPRSRRGTGSIGTRTLFPAVCAACGRQTRLPFKPRGDRPPYCSDCFGQRRG